MSNEFDKTLYSNIAIDKEDLLLKIDEVKSSLVKPFAELFRENIYNVSDLLALPARVGSYSYLHYAIKKSLADAGPNVDVKAFITHYYNKYYDAKGRNEIAKISIDWIGKLLSGDSELSKSFQALLYSATVNTWSSFEILAGDIWATLLSQPQYTPPKKPGAYSFSNVWRINEAYEAINLKNSIESITNKPTLFLLEKTRHLIAHKRGVVDQKFYDEISSIVPVPAGLPTISIGKSIFIDMELKSQFIETVIKAGYELILAIDNILSPVH